MLTKKRALLFVGSLATPFAEMKYTKTLRELNNKIIECKFENKQWIFMRERTDKSYPNAYTTAVCKLLKIQKESSLKHFLFSAVCNSIQHPVTKENLLEFIDKHRFKDSDSEQMPPPHR